jgi:hypothetical protein
MPFVALVAVLAATAPALNVSATPAELRVPVPSPVLPDLYSFAAAADGRTAVSGRFAELLQWDTVTGAVIAKAKVPSSLTNVVAISPHGDRVAAGDGEGAIHLFAGGTLELLRTISWTPGGDVTSRWARRWTHSPGEARRRPRPSDS